MLEIGSPRPVPFSGKVAILDVNFLEGKRPLREFRTFCGSFDQIREGLWTEKILTIAMKTHARQRFRAHTTS